MENRSSTESDKKISKIAKNLVTEYTDNGSIHGISFIGDSKRHWIERLFWTIVFVTSIYFAWILIMESYIKWRENQIITNVDEYPTLMSEIPFPAITICPNDKYDKKKFDMDTFYKNFSNTQAQYENYIKTKSRYFTKKFKNFRNNWVKTLFQICTGYITLGKDIPYYNASITSRDYVRELKKLSFAYPFYYCTYKAVAVECKETFTELLTDSGICYTLNIIDSAELFRDDV